jgi:hypothetical protein
MVKIYMTQQIINVYINFEFDSIFSLTLHHLTSSLVDEVFHFERSLIVGCLLHNRLRQLQ